MAIDFDYELGTCCPGTLLMPYDRAALPGGGQMELTLDTAMQIKHNFDLAGHDVPILYGVPPFNSDGSPAAGWVQALAATPEGLKCSVEWTTRAETQVAAGYFRFIVPVLRVSAKDPRTGKPIGMALHALALTHHPGLVSLNHARALALAVSLIGWAAMEETVWSDVWAARPEDVEEWDAQVEEGPPHGTE